MTYRDISWHDYSFFLADISHYTEREKATLTLYKRDKRQANSDGRENK
jgi:hypothetical protein